MHGGVTISAHEQLSKRSTSFEKCYFFFFLAGFLAVFFAGFFALLFVLPFALPLVFAIALPPPFCWLSGRGSALGAATHSPRSNRNTFYYYWTSRS